MYLSTRDMARLGLMMLRGGRWKEQQLVPPNWGLASTRLVTPHHDMEPLQLHLETTARRWGYGILWWVWDAPAWPGVQTGPYQGAYAAMGAGGQYIIILPTRQMVVVHKVDIDVDESREVKPEEFDAILQMIIASAK